MVIARLSLPENVWLENPTEAVALPTEEPVWKAPCDAVIGTTNVRDVPSQIGVNEADPWAAPWETVMEDDWPVAPLGQATATASRAPAPATSMSWPWSATRT